MGLLTAFLFFVAFNLQAGWVYAVDALLVGVLMVGFISAGSSVRGITLHRQMPHEAYDGDRVYVTCRVAASAWPRFFVEVVDAIPGCEPHLELLSVLPGGRGIDVTYHVAVMRRGIHRPEWVEVRSRGLTGFFSARQRIAAPGTLVAFPRYWPIARFPLGNQVGRGPLVHPRRRTTSGLDVYGVREYRDGDSLRHVHWRSSARRGTLVVREFEEEDREAATLLIDARPGVHGGEGPNRPFEDLVRAAASIAHFVTAGGRAVRLVTSHGAVPDSALVQWRGALEFLARIEPDGTLSPDDLYTLASLPPTAPVVVLSADAAAAATLIRRRVVTAAVLVDPSSYLKGGNPPGEAAGDPLHTLGAPMCILREGEDIATCLESCA